MEPRTPSWSLKRRIFNKLALLLFPLVTALAAAAAPAAANEPGLAKLYVTNSAGDNIHVIDLDSFKVIRKIKTGDRPHGAAVSRGRRWFFTTVESTNALLVINTTTDEIVKSIKLTGLPNQCAV